jgi:hypothetical protein
MLSPADVPEDYYDSVLHALGIKVLSFENFRKAEMVSMMFTEFGLNTMGPAYPIEDELRRRVEWFTRFTLPEHVPEPVLKMFEVAKGAMVYGLFFYPLYTLGEDHLSRLYEHMVKDQYARKSGKSTANFKTAVTWLSARKLFPEDLPLKWLAKYEIRNRVSHPRDQAIATPADAVRALRDTQELALHFYADLAPSPPASASGSVPVSTTQKNLNSKVNGTFEGR